MDANQKNKDLFLRAAMAGDVDEMERCVTELKVDINTPNQFGETALMINTFASRIWCIHFLIKNGADVDIAGGRRQESALFKAARVGEKDCLKPLIDAGANLNLVDFEQKTALMKAVGNNRTECTELLVKGGAFVNAVDTGGVTALMRASFRGNSQSVKCLLDANAIVDIVDCLGQTALMKAAMGGRVECLEILLEFGADVRIMDNTSSTALVKATRSWHPTRGRSSEAPDDNSDPMDHPDSEGSDDDNPVDILGRQFTCVKLLCDKGADVNAVDSKGETTLMKAAAIGHEECVQFLLEKGANINAINDRGDTAVMIAVRYSRENILRLLIKNKAELHYTNMSGRNALLISVSRMHKACMYILLEQDADPNIVDHSNCWTPLMQMADVGDVHSVKKLLEAGAFVRIMDIDGKTALDRARENKHWEVVRVLEQWMQG